MQTNTTVYRAHSLQHDIPHIFKLSPTLPALSPEENPDVLPAFCSLCKLFWLFDSATEGRTEGLSHAIAAQLQEQYSMPSYGNEVQRADLLVTEPWLRIVLWKNALPFMTMTTEADSGGLSPFFPVEAARHLLGGLESVASDTLELHGPGMVCSSLNKFDHIDTNPYRPLNLLKLPIRSPMLSYV